MKKCFLLIYIICSMLLAQAQPGSFGPFRFVLPEGFSLIKEKNLALISDAQKELCLVFSTGNNGKGTEKENFTSWWKSDFRFPHYLITELPGLNSFGENGYSCIQGRAETEHEGFRITIHACIYKSGSTYNAYMGFTSNPETARQVDDILKSIKTEPVVVPAVISPLEQSYNWYTKIRGVAPGALTLSAYQSLTNLNFTGFYCPYPTYLLALGDSLIHLRILTVLQSLSVGQSQFSDKAALHIGTHPSLRFVDAVSQGMAIPLSDAGMQRLSLSKSIENLQLLATDIPGVTNTGLAYLANMTQLKSLSVGRAPAVTITGIEQLYPLKLLINLDLSGCTISDADMPRLKNLILQLPALQSIKLQYCGLSEAGTEIIRTIRTPFVILY